MSPCDDPPSADLVVDESFALAPDPADAPPASRDRARRDHEAFAVHAALRQLRAARHEGEIHLASLLRLMVRSHGYRAWGHRGFPDYVMEELRQSSPRRFQDLVRIERAIVERPLPRLGNAWRHGEILVSQARELARVAAPDTEKEWLEAARCMSVRRLRREVQRALRDPRAQMRPGCAASPQGGSTSGERAACGPGHHEDEEEPARRTTFAATVPVDAAWQVFLDTARRMAGFDAPVHDCVDDLLAEYASGCTLLPDGVPAVTDEERSIPDPLDGSDRPGRHAMDEAAADLDRLRRAGRGARLVVSPLEGLPVDSEPDPQDLHRRIRWVLRVQQRVAWHEMRLARLVATSRLYLRLGFDSFARYAEEALDMSPRGAWSLVSLGHSLRDFARVAEAFRAGRITALEAREICRVAHGDTQADWLARAATSTLQQLREEVAFVLATDDPAGLPPSRPLPAAMKPVAEPPAARPGAGPSHRRIQRHGEVQMCASRTSATTATTTAHRAEQWYSAFGRDPFHVAEVMLAPHGRVRPVGFVAPDTIATQWSLTLRDCRERLASLARDATAAACVSDSQCVAILLLNFLGQWASPEALNASRAMKVFTRDGWRCQAPRCRSRAHLNAHHIVFRSHNGPDAPWNLVTVCRAHHEMLHGRTIRVRGRAPGGLVWSMGVNATGEVRERFCHGIRVELDEDWSAGDRGPGGVRASDDWRSACASTP